MKSIEIEVRNFISSTQFKDLEKKLKKIAKFLKEGRDETIYFGGRAVRFGGRDLRLRRDNNFSYLILKSGKIHDNFREEIKISFKRDDFKKLKDLFERLGFKTTVIWFRKRKVYDWKGIKAFLGDTKGYGKIIELEKIGTEKDKKKIYDDLKAKLSALGIKKITPKKEFDKKFQYYKNNWRMILKLNT